MTVRTAVVTGAARGLGAAIAERLAADSGYAVVADINLAGAEEVAAAIDGVAVEHDVRSLASWECLLERRNRRRAREQRRPTIHVGRLGRPEEIPAAVVLLASDAAGFVTGATLDVNGGMLMR